MIDIGVNLTNPRFDKDRDELLIRAKTAGLSHLLITGTCLATSQAAYQLTLSQPNFLSTTAGIHPHDADGVSVDYLSELTLLAQHSTVRAIGECGLDFNRNFSTPDNQVRVFSEQVELASTLAMPLFLHQRDAFDTWIDILAPYVGQVPAMVSHCFTGNKRQLIRCLDAGMYIGITGWLCDRKRGQELRDIVKYIPLNRLMIETDAPYLIPQNIKPKPKSSRNEPSYLPYVVELLAEVTNYSPTAIIEHSQNNSVEVFNFEK